MQSNKFVTINLSEHFVNDALYLLACDLRKKKERDWVYGFVISFVATNAGNDNNKI